MQKVSEITAVFSYGAMAANRPAQADMAVDMSSHEQRLCTEFGSHENVIDSRIYMRECADVVTAELSGVGSRFNYTARPHARLVGEFYKNQL